VLPLFFVAAAIHCAGTADPRCPLFGDVDGDGKADAVYVTRTAPCRFALVVETRGRTLRARVREPFCRGKPSEFWRSGLPRVAALRPMTSRRGLEPEVVTWSGASNFGIRFYTVFHARLQVMRITPEPFPRDEWNVGGFAAAYTLHDCLRPHVVGVNGASFDLRRWRTFGSIYRTTATAFVRVALRTATVPRDPAPTQIWPYVHGDAFSRCHGVVRLPPL
jgi:hypothetical protein